MIVSNEMIADFVTEHHEPSRDWPRKRLLEWVGWFRRDGRCAVITKGPKLVGLALARPLSVRHSETDHYALSAVSKTIYVDLVVGSKKLMRSMIQLLRQRFPRATKIKFSRLKRGLTSKTYNLDQFERRLNHG